MFGAFGAVGVTAMVVFARFGSVRGVSVAFVVTTFMFALWAIVSAGVVP